MLHVFIIVVVLVAIAFAGFGVGVFVKGKFPDTHVGHNAEMKKLGITCAKHDGAFCQGRTNTESSCQGCSA